MKTEGLNDGQLAFLKWQADLFADPEVRRLYVEDGPKQDLWLALSDARFAAGLTQAEVANRMGVSQAQVARIEAHGYDRHSLNTLRRYVQALGDDFRLDVTIRIPDRLKGILEQPNPLVRIPDEDEAPAQAPKATRSRRGRALTASQQ